MIRTACCKLFKEYFEEDIVYLEDGNHWCFVINRSGDPNFGYSLIIYHCPWCGAKL